VQIDRARSRVQPWSSIVPEAYQPKNRPLLSRMTLVLALQLVLGVSLMLGQQQPLDAPTPQAGPQGGGTGSGGPQSGSQSGGTGTGGNPQEPATKGDVAALQQQLQKNLEAQEKESEYLLVLGIGSLVNAGHSDYENDSNVLNAKNLGHSSPQFLTGVAFRTHVPNFPGFCDDCTDTWRKRPFSAFVSLKFAPGASEVLNGYVLGGSYSIAHHLDVLIGFALSKSSEPSPGFRKVAAKVVRDGQPKGLYTTFDPVAMEQNKDNAFDGFPLTDVQTNALIYQGNALATHYRGGVVFGVSFPVSFKSIF
jgi:hypothetical protein